jgi:glycosyltransferase involved in cell wall biosynthesis
MPKISAVIITFNEEVYIEQCIKSVAEVADEVIIVDSYSTDRTKEICLSLGVRFIEHPFNGYRDQKNFALEQASCDYVLSLDADEAISPKLEKSILSVKQDLRYDGYKFDRLNNYCGKWIYFTNLSPERRIRLFDRKKAKWGGLNIHEKIVLDNPKSVMYLKGKLLHWLCDSYEENIEKMNRYSTLLANEYFNAGVRPTAKKLLINPLWRFIHSYFLKGGFLDGYDGFIVSKVLSITCFLKYSKLRKLCVREREVQMEAKTRGKVVNLDQNSFQEKNQKPIAIGFDAKRAFYNYSGLGNYSRTLLFALSEEYSGNSYYLFTPTSKDRVIVENEKQFNIIEPVRATDRLFRQVWRFKYMNKDIRQRKLQIFHGLSQELPVGIEKTGVRSVVTVHDLIFLRYPEFYNKIDAKIYYWKLVHACRVSDHIVAISNQTKNDLIRFLNIAPEKISVIRQGCNQYFWQSYSKKYLEEVRVKYNLPEKYLLYVGTIEERKNLLGIVKAMHISKISMPLVVIGRKAGPYYKNVLNYISIHKITNVLFPNNILNFELPAIYQNAECFIYPSFFEGFGIPILEALVSKTPVITSSRSCFAEAAGPGSIFIDPFDSEKIGEAIHKVINNKDLRDKMISMGTDYANNFTDEVVAKSYMKLYYSLLQ